jgi:hypothetical protein
MVMPRIKQIWFHERRAWQVGNLNVLNGGPGALSQESDESVVVAGSAFINAGFRAARRQFRGVDSMGNDRVEFPGKRRAESKQTILSREADDLNINVDIPLRVFQRAPGV